MIIRLATGAMVEVVVPFGYILCSDYDLDLDLGFRHFARSPRQNLIGLWYFQT